MRRGTLAIAIAALISAGLWHLPATAQKPATAQNPPVAAPSEAGISFDQYRDFRLHYIAQRRAQLARQLAAPDLDPAKKARLAETKAYYDRQAAMPEAERDKLYRARFEQIDTNRDGQLDEAERAAWRAKRRAYYAERAAERDGVGAEGH